MAPIVRLAVPRDHFSAVATQYARSRPSYPNELFSWLAQQCARRELAWDVGAGTGQASLGLARHFMQVIGTDLSVQQLASAPMHERVTYRVAAAERSGLGDKSVDLVTIAQALHWFDLEPFYAEVRRVARPAGLVAAWTYGILSVQGRAVDDAVQRYYHDVVGPYWPQERRHVETGYSELPFPFRRLDPPSFAMRARWTLDELLGYFASWSASARMLAQTGQDPIRIAKSALEDVWGPPGEPREVSWPLSLLVGSI